jgi:ferredoxin
MTRDAVLHVDWTRCRGRGLCTELLPELIGRDADGYPLVGTDVTVPGELLGPARTAVRDCPRLALAVREADPP